MENKQVKTTIFEILKQDKRLWDEEQIELNQTLLLDLIDKIDTIVIDLLLQEEALRDKFFVKIKDAYVFKTNDFKFFMEENKINNSYTTYKNRIGLTDGKRFLKDTNDVVLDFPYKDCVLEGGQSSEEGEDYYFEYDEKITKTEEKKGYKANSYNLKSTKRKEIFFNQIIAQDEIDRLFDEKAFVNWKRYTKDGEKDVRDIKRDDDGNIKENLIIKGNNLLVLHSLKSKFSGKVKVIYIDPPYNTGSDSFKYNDNFNHSTWLTFMRNRFEVAKSLLRDDGSIYISIDDNELGYMTILLDEIFGKDNRTDLITVKRGSVTGHKAINPGVVNISDFLIGYAKNKSLWDSNRIYKARERNVRYNNYVLNRSKEIDQWEFCSLLDAFAEYKGIVKTKLKKELGSTFEKEIFEFIKLNSDSVIQFAYPDEGKISAELKEIIKKSKKQKDKVFHLKREKELDVYIRNGQRLLFYTDRLMNLDGEIVTVEPMSNIWDDVLPNDLHNEGGVKLKKGKKPEKLLRRILELTTNQNDIVLDYHVGSGTTAAVAHKMGRQYIGIEQLDYGENDSVVRVKNVIAGDQTGISKAVNWQEGGDFIYFELAKWNEKAKEEINTCENLEALEKLFDSLYEKYFLNYNLKVKEFKEKVIKEDEFKALNLEEQKRMLLTMLDLNQMYVQKSEMEDKRFGIGKEDQKLTVEFYNDEN